MGLKTQGIDLSQYQLNYPGCQEAGSLQFTHDTSGEGYFNSDDYQALSAADKEKAIMDKILDNTNPAC